eukprot:453398_1
MANRVNILKYDRSEMENKMVKLMGEQADSLTLKSQSQALRSKLAEVSERIEESLQRSSIESPGASFRRSTINSLPASGDSESIVSSIDAQEIEKKRLEAEAEKQRIAQEVARKKQADDAARCREEEEQNQSRNPVKVEGVNLYISVYLSTCTANLDPFPEEEFKGFCERYPYILKGDNGRRLRNGKPFHPDARYSIRPWLKPHFANGDEVKEV